MIESIALSIKQKALELGYEKCGIIPIPMLDGYQEKLEERVKNVPDSGVFYKGQQRLAHVQEEFPWAKSVIILTVPYSMYHVPENVSGHIGKSYLFDVRINENTTEYQQSRRLELYLQSLGLKVEINRKFGVVGMRWAALQAGLGIIRRNNFFYTESGSWVHLEAFLIDMELELKSNTTLPPCPKNCDRCIKACPTASLCNAYTMNPLRCISFLTTFGGRNLPQEPMAENFGEWIYGCDVYQDVCPMNHKKWAAQEAFPGLTELAPSLTAEALLNMGEDFYRDKVQPKFFYLTADELWKWKVNALNFIKNHYQEQYRQLVLDALESPYPKVREMAESICVLYSIDKN